MKRSGIVPAVAVGSLALLALTACGGSSSSSGSSSAAATKAASTAQASPSPTNTAQTALQWCKAYAEITTSLSSSQPTVEGAQTSLNALKSFDQLFAAGANLGYISNAESEANRRAVVAYSKVMKQLADGKKADSTEVKDAQKALTEQTGKDQALLNSSSTKIQALCAPLTLPTATASSGAQPSGAAPSSATPSSAAPSPSKS